MSRSRRELSAFAEAEYDRQARFLQNDVSISVEARAGQTQHWLALGYEEENLIPSLRGPGGALDFFGERGIHWWRAEGREDAEVRDRPTHNLASSQVACVNFLMPLARHPMALLAALKVVRPDVAEILPIDHGGRTTLVEFEWVGQHGPLEPIKSPRGRFCTSVDAAVLARTSTGRCLFLFEWKYTETCGCELGPGSNATRLRWYRDLYRSSGLFTAPLETMLLDPAYQVIRSVLVGARTVRNAELGCTEAVSVIVCPKANDAYRVLPGGHNLAGPQPLRLENLLKGRLLAREVVQVESQRALIDAIVASGFDLPPGWLDYHERRYAWR